MGSEAVDAGRTDDLSAGHANVVFAERRSPSLDLPAVRATRASTSTGAAAQTDDATSNPGSNAAVGFIAGSASGGTRAGAAGKAEGRVGSRPAALEEWATRQGGAGHS